MNEKRVARLMGELGIAGISGRRKVKTTRRDPAATPAPDLVERDFAADRPDELWVTDVTYSAQLLVMCRSVVGGLTSGGNRFRGLHIIKGLRGRRGAGRLVVIG